MKNLRVKAMIWWNSILGRQYPMLVKHEDVITGGKQRHPTELTGREIEDLYKAELKYNE